MEGTTDLSGTLAGLDLAVPSRLTKQLDEALQGDFEVVRLIARGGMGLVFLGRDVTLQREVAIKVLLADAFTTKSEVARFKLEAQTIAALSHPHIVPVYSVREHEDMRLYIMQYIDGDTLQEKIERGPMPAEEVISIMAMIGDALDHAHEKGIVHRDVKPANIIVDQRGRAYIMDFGIAQLPEQTGLTVAGSLVGTPNYASPEQCRAEVACPESDQYSLGVVAYEMLSGDPMFSSDTMSGIIHHHLHTEPPSVADRCPDCPQALVESVDRMVAKAPEARWPSVMDAVLHAAEGAVVGTSLERVFGTTPRPGSETRRPDKASPSEPSATRSHRRPGLLPIAAVLLLVAAAAMASLAVRGSLTPLPAEAITAQNEPLSPADETILDASPGPSTSRPPDPQQTADEAMSSNDAASGNDAASDSDAASEGATADPLPDASNPVTSGPNPEANTPALTESPAANPAANPVTPPVLTPGLVLLGTRGLAAVLYVNDEPLGAASRLRSWEVDAGEAHLSLRVAGCPAWDSTVVVPSGGEVRLGYRLQSC